MSDYLTVQSALFEAYPHNTTTSLSDEYMMQSLAHTVDVPTVEGKLAAIGFSDATMPLRHEWEYEVLLHHARITDSAGAVAMWGQLTNTDMSPIEFHGINAGRIKPSTLPEGAIVHAIVVAIQDAECKQYAITPDGPVDLVFDDAGANSLFRTLFGSSMLSQIKKSRVDKSRKRIL